jgi:2-polyprenyl-3-methyl-5-hydroxy-6-metoxy-1,4-benzoquinol methylase
VLDLGCASGAVGAALKATRPREVVGIELATTYVQTARTRLDQVIHTELESFLSDPEAVKKIGTFDCLIAADVLEHLRDPWSALTHATRALRPGGVAVISVPNVRHWRTFVELGLRGTWPRRDVGIFDRTHLRWFTQHDAEALVSSAELEVDAVIPQWGVAGWHRLVVAPLKRTSLRGFIPTQYIIRGVKPL